MKKIIIVLSLISVFLFLFACSSANIQKDQNTDMDETQNAPESQADSTAFDKDSTFLPEGIDPNDYEKFVVFPLPEGSFRQAAVDYMKKLATFEFTVSETFSTGKSRDNWEYKLVYKEGETYTGLPYSSSNRPLGQFEKYIEENQGFFTCHTPEVNSSGENDICGVECNSSTCAAFQQFIPDVCNVARQYMPSFEKDFVGILCGEYVVPENAQKTADIVAANKPQTILECYAQLDIGDIVMNKNETAGLCHVRMISQKPTVVRTASGQINTARSYVLCVEQTDTFDATRKDGVKTTWRVDKRYTFDDLLSSTYIPITFEVYKTNKSVNPYLAFDELPKESLLAKGSVSGTVSSDYPIQFCYLSLYNTDGKLINRVAQQDRLGTKKINLRKHSAMLFENDIPSGKYTFVVEAGLHAGTAELCRIDFDYNG